MRLLFVKDSLAWPRAAGHDVHGYSMMRALGRLGHEVALLTRQAPANEALDGLTLDFHDALDDGDGRANDGIALAPLQERYLSYWGVRRAHLRRVRDAAQLWEADAVVAVGLDALPYLAGVTDACRVWYAADEAAWNHLSQVSARAAAAWSHCKQAAINGLYERAFAPCLDRVWVVSERDRTAMRWVAGAREVDVIPNGVDGDYYCPQDGPTLPQSCVFWGRLDFEPNLHALDWFCRRVWPLARRAVPDATFAIYGRFPTAAAQELAAAPGITLVADLPDLRSEVTRHAVAVLPFVSGGGIKNKLLEAASLGQAIVCTPRACNGLRADAPLMQAATPSQWVDALVALWTDAERRQDLGRRARAWVLANHTWEAAARAAIQGIETSSAPAYRPLYTATGRAS